MQDYKVTGKKTATKLKLYFENAYRFKCVITPLDPSAKSDDDTWVVKAADNLNHPCWREICEAFVAGRASTVD